ncbi:MAG: histidine kinase [Ferruginibacter sp.]
MNQIKYIVQPLILLFCFSSICCAQSSNSAQTQESFKKASGKISKGFKKNNSDTLASGYYDLGETFYQQGSLVKSETYFKKARSLYEMAKDDDGIAKSSRALARVQEDLDKKKEAVVNYNIAADNNLKTGDTASGDLNKNDIRRLTKKDSFPVQQALILKNINLGLVNKDTGEVISQYARMASTSLVNNQPKIAVEAYKNAYHFSTNAPVQALQFNQKITDVYLQEKNFSKAIETKQEALNEPFVQNSTQLKAKEITSLADIYLKKKEEKTAVELLTESYQIAVQNGHIMEARQSLERLDSIYQATGRKDQSLLLYKDFLLKLPSVIDKDSSIAANKLIADTEMRIRELETEKALKDDLIRRKNIFNYWLLASLIILGLLTAVVLFMFRKLRVKNKKIALQSLRREMNPHFIFNSLNSINQFIATSNELGANRYLTKFSNLMRRVMENSKEDFVLFSNEMELLQNYLELEKSRFPEKFDFSIHTDDALLAEENLFIPGMLIQPHLENAIWHGLRYKDDKGYLKLRFQKSGNGMLVIIEDNGIGIAESKKFKTQNQKKHTGRGISNTMERISILNELYHQHISCVVEDRPEEGVGARVKLFVPLIKNFTA